jgi:hypothetical protein
MTAYDHHMPPVLIIALYVLAAARLTGLVTVDEITRPAREKLVSRFDAHRRTHRWIVYLTGGADDRADGCQWCASVWVAAGTAPIVYHWYDNPAVSIPMLALAASQIVGMVNSLGRE